MSAAGGLLAFRPAAAARLLPAGSQACPLSACDLLRGLAGRRRPLPVVVAPLPAVARAALLAAKRAGAALGLALPRGHPPEPWFAAVTRAAHELAPRLPLVLRGEVALPEGGEPAVERAEAEACRLVEAGFGQLALDAAGAPSAERGRALARLAAAAVEREVGVECILPWDGPGEPESAASFVGELEAWGLRPDLVGVRCGAPEGAAAIRAQALGIAALAAAVGPARLARRGGWPPALLRVLGPAGTAAADDGEQVLDAALAPLPEARRLALRAAPERGRKPARLEGGEEERIEARAFVAAEVFIEGLDAAGTAAPLAAALGAGRR